MQTWLADMQETCLSCPMPPDILDPLSSCRLSGSAPSLGFEATAHALLEGAQNKIL